MANSQRMSDEEYATTQEHLLFVAHFCRGLELAAFLSRIGISEALGPIIHPTLYNEAGEPLRDIKRLAQSLQPFQAEVFRQVENHKKIRQAATDAVLSPSKEDTEKDGVCSLDNGIG